MGQIEEKNQTYPGIYNPIESKRKLLIEIVGCCKGKEERTNSVALCTVNSII